MMQIFLAEPESCVVLPLAFRACAGDNNYEMVINLVTDGVA